MEVIQIEQTENITEEASVEYIHSTQSKKSCSTERETNGDLNDFLNNFTIRFSEGFY